MNLRVTFALNNVASPVRDDNTRQFSDGQCICRTGYEYYDEGGILVSARDASVDCQPIVYERCYFGEALDADGTCLSER